MQRAIVCLALLTSGASLARADSFYLRYNADETFPEQEGWVRYTQGPWWLSERGLRDGIFRLDTRASASIADHYMVTDPALEPAMGQFLRLTWCMRTLESDLLGDMSDVDLGITNAARQNVQFFVAPEFVVETGDGPPWDPEHWYPLKPGAFHTYLFVTSDMQTYELYVDGAFAFGGEFRGTSFRPGPNVGFGDVIVGLSSLSEWDFVEVAVVPEPSAALSAALPGFLWSIRRRGSRGVR